VIAPAFHLAEATAAADVFHGAFCYSVLKGASVRDALEFSNTMAALNCTKLGALIERGKRRSRPDFAPPA